MSEITVNIYDLTIEIELTCEDCGRILELNEIHNKQLNRWVRSVNPCEHCKAEVEREARSEGYDEGFEEGKDEGRV